MHILKQKLGFVKKIPVVKIMKTQKHGWTVLPGLHIKQGARTSTERKGEEYEIFC